MPTKKMSLRQIAAQLGITPAYLSYMVNGKRPWREDLREGYRTLVNTTVAQSVNKMEADKSATRLGNGMVGGNGFEPMTSSMSTMRSNQLS